MTKWQPMSRPPVPHYPPGYWANVSQMIQQSAYRNHNVGVRPTAGVGNEWQPPASGQSLMNDNSVMST